MESIDKGRFGAFVSALRKEEGLTQKELAQRLFVSDKAVSKWERGLSMPDVELLLPLGEALGVSVTELLSGQRMPREEPWKVDAVDRLVAGTVELSAQERKAREAARRRRSLAYLLCGAVGLGEVCLLVIWGAQWAELAENVLLVEGLSLLFGAWLCFFAPDTLPAYYDENRISFYGDGVFRMNLAGIRLNNSNWPHILRGMRLWLLGASVLFPAAWWAAEEIFPARPLAVDLTLKLTAMVGLFLPAYFAGKRYE